MLKVVAVLCCLLTNGYAQELVATAVNSPEALALNTQLENIKEERDALRSERSLLKNDTQEKSKAKKEELEREINSLSERLFEIRKLFAVEILRSGENQEIIKKMNKALSSGQMELAGKINIEYERKLRDQATQKLLAKEIDRPTFREEMKAIDKVVSAISTIVFVPRVLTSGGHGHE
jgi:hypothetical protein